MAMQELILITVAALVALAVSGGGGFSSSGFGGFEDIFDSFFAAAVAVLLIQMHQDKAPIYNIQFN